MPEWILASASPRRKEILTRLGLTFRVDPSNIQEPARKPKEPCSRYVVRLARMKARETGRKYDSAMVIGADTIVVLDDRLLGKPVSRDDAKNMLFMLGGHWHEVVSGICILNSQTGHSKSNFSISRVHFRPLPLRDIEWYLETGEYRDKAGAYAIQGYASLFIDRIEGCYFNIVGFPVSAFEALCRKSAIRR
ncbi:MAG: Maf family protein [Acidobacteriota bacterium]